MLMAKRNYKVYASIGFSTRLVVRKLSVMDTGAGPNFIRKSELPDGKIREIRKTPLPEVTDANRNPIRMIGTIDLIVQLGNCMMRTEFIVCERLADPVILGCDFCDRFIEAIYPRKRLVELDDGSTVPIVRRPLKRDSTAPPLPAAQEYTPAKGRASPKVKCSRAVILQPGTQTWVEVTTDRNGLLVVQPHDKLYQTGRVLATNGIVEVEPHQKFHLLMANFGTNPYRVTKGQVIATVLPHPMGIIPTKVSTADVLGIAEPDSPEEYYPNKDQNKNPSYGYIRRAHSHGSRKQIPLGHRRPLFKARTYSTVETDYRLCGGASLCPALDLCLRYTVGTPHR